MGLCQHAESLNPLISWELFVISSRSTWSWMLPYVRKEFSSLKVEGQQLDIRTFWSPGRDLSLGRATVLRGRETDEWEALWSNSITVPLCLYDRPLWSVRTVSGLWCFVLLCCNLQTILNCIYKEPAFQSINKHHISEPQSFLRAFFPSGFTGDPSPSNTPAEERVPTRLYGTAGTAYSLCASEAFLEASWGKL